MSEIIASGQITLSSFSGIEESDMQSYVQAMKRSLENDTKLTLNNAFWPSQGGAYIYFGNQEAFRKEGSSAVRLANNSLSICINGDIGNSVNGNDIELARFSQDSLMLQGSYELKYDGDKGLYFSPLK